MQSALSGRSTHDEVELRLDVARREVAADGVVAIELRLPTGQELPAWTPGSHIDVVLSPELTRQYSLCGDPIDSSVWRIAVLREQQGRGGSAYIHDNLHAGATVDIRGPRNHFALTSSPRYLFIAGGVGITPLMPMVASAHAAGATWELHYGGRNLNSMAFGAQLVTEYGSAVTLHPQDEEGLLNLDALLGTPQPDTLVYRCGPEALLQAVEKRCAAWPTAALHVERFAPREQQEPVRHDTFEVQLAQRGVTIVVSPEQTVLQAVRDAGVEILSSCGEGTCGTCETRVLAGEVDHRDSLLSPEEQEANDTMFICVSRAASSRLVLDL